MDNRKRSIAFKAASDKWAKRPQVSGVTNDQVNHLRKDRTIIVVNSDDETEPEPPSVSPLLILQNASIDPGTPHVVTMDSLMGSPQIIATWQFNFNVDLELALSYLHPDISKFQREVTFVVGSSIFQNDSDLILKDRYNLRQFVAPLPNKFASHHTKMMVNFYSLAVEIVIMSCNLTKLDITALTQTVWRSGRLPYIETPVPSSFKHELKLYLKRYNLPALADLALKLDYYDFLSVTAQLVTSAPGTYDMKNPQKSNGLCGYGRLFDLLCEHGLLNSVTPNATTNYLAQATSIAYPYTFAKGQVSSIFSHILCPLVFSHSLDDFMSLKPGSDSCRSHQEQKKYSSHLVYPTVREVSQSLVGFSSGQALHFDYSKSSVHKAHYLQAVKPCLRKYTSTDSGARGRDIMMPHLKILLCDNGDDWRTIKWLYFGSHNLSKQAWGMPIRYKTFDPLIYKVDSYELGVFVTPRIGQRFLPASDTRPVKSERKSDIQIPLPFPVPPENYGPDDKPWSMHQSYPGVFDRFGQEFIVE